MKAKPIEPIKWTFVNPETKEGTVQQREFALITTFVWDLSAFETPTKKVVMYLLLLFFNIQILIFQMNPFLYWTTHLIYTSCP